jgi:hypothetical protein
MLTHLHLFLLHSGFSCYFYRWPPNALPSMYMCVNVHTCMYMYLHVRTCTWNTINSKTPLRKRSFRKWSFRKTVISKTITSKRGHFKNRLFRKWSISQPFNMKTINFATILKIILLHEIFCSFSFLHVFWLALDLPSVIVLLCCYPSDTPVR